MDIKSCSEGLRAIAYILGKTEIYENSGIDLAIERLTKILLNEMDACIGQMEEDASQKMPADQPPVIKTDCPSMPPAQEPKARPKKDPELVKNRKECREGAAHE